MSDDVDRDIAEFEKELRGLVRREHAVQKAVEKALEELEKLKDEFLVMKSEVEFVGRIGHKLANHVYRLKEDVLKSKGDPDASPPVSK